MPYIHGDTRRLELKTGARPETAGELDYVLTIHALRFIQARDTDFETLNTVIGVLDNVKDEIRRRLLHEYEDARIVLNGDVF